MATNQGRPKICRNGFARAGVEDAVFDPGNIASASHDDCNDDYPFQTCDDNDVEDHVVNECYGVVLP